MAETSLADRVDEQFRSINLALNDTNGMMRHILDCLGALKVRLEEEQESVALTSVFSSSVTTIVNHISGHELIDSECGLKYLLQSFPDSSKRRDGRGWLPLHWAAAIHDTDPSHLKSLVQDRPFATRKGHLPCENTSLEEAGENAYKGILPLHFAVSVRHPSLSIIETLIETTPEVLSLPDHRGWLPIHWCAYNCRNSKAMTLLIENYVDGCFIANKKGKLPFQLSAYNRCTDMMELLLHENPEAIDGLDYNGNTAMHG